MREQIQLMQKEIDGFAIANKDELEAFRIAYLGSKGKIKDLFAGFKTVPNEEKKEVGQLINQLKQNAQAKYDSFKEDQANNSPVFDAGTDLTRPGVPLELGARHPLNVVREEIIQIFDHIGFNLSEGPEIEDDWHNFSALNFPPEHPARDMQDTFFVEGGNGDHALRTHTSSVQVRVMENEKPPIRTISPGRVFRNEAISSRAHCIFHQIEGLYIDKGVSFADLKQTLQYFAKSFFGKTEIRLRPSYFPFTEPSAEVDVYWGLNSEADYRITKGTGWLEIMGCGMVDPNVLQNCGIDPNEYSGYAFGMGIERIAMLKYQINDLRLFFENDARFLEQFKPAF